MCEKSLDEVLKDLGGRMVELGKEGVSGKVLEERLDEMIGELEDLLG